MDPALDRTQPLLSYHNVAVTFRRWFAPPKQALRGVSLHVGRGEVVGLLGPNGAGKSTLMRIACGLVWPGTGSVAVDGMHPGRHAAARRQIGAVLESERWMVWQLSGRENLNYFACLRGMTDSGARWRRVDECIETVGLTEAAKRPVGEYSRGMKQRLALAGALLTDPTLLLLDEPTLGLDLEGQALIRQLLVRLTEQGKGVLLATHQLELAARYAHRIAFLRAGELVTDQPVARLLERYAPSEFEIVVRGSIGQVSAVATVFGCQVQSEDDTVVLHCPPAVAADPYPLLTRLGAQGLTLVRAGLTSPDLEEVYQRILQEDGACSGGPSAQPSSGAAG